MKLNAKVVVARPLFQDLLSPLRERCDMVELDHEAAESPERFRDELRAASVVVTTLEDRIDKATLGACPHLRLVANVAVGLDNIDLDECRSRGVAVTHTPGVLDDATADHAWALLLGAARRVAEAQAWLQSGQWQRWEVDRLLGVPVHGRTLGLVGFGRIGQAIARRSRGFDMRVLIHQRNPPAGDAGVSVQAVPLATLLAQSDFVVVAVPYGPRTHHLIASPQLASMKPSAVLVNVSRGGVVHDEALALALSEGRLAAAGIDVFEGEPKVCDRLLCQERALLTPHIASATTDTRRAMVGIAIRNVSAWLDGVALPTPVS